MRVISWNIRRNPKAIAYAFGTLGADVLLTQECPRLEFPSLHQVGSTIDERWVRHKWGNFAFSKTELQSVLIPTEYKGSLQLHSTSSLFGNLLLVNLYGLFEPIALGSRSKMATPGVHRKLSDLSPVLFNKTATNFDAILLMGDFNHDRRMDSHKNFRKSEAMPFINLFQRIEGMGLSDLLQRDYPDGVQTYRSVRGNFPWQLDHAFVTKRFASRATSSVVQDAQTSQVSDHFPVIVDLF